MDPKAKLFRHRLQGFWCFAFQFQSRFKMDLWCSPQMVAQTKSWRASWAKSVPMLLVQGWAGASSNGKRVIACVIGWGFNIAACWSVVSQLFGSGKLIETGIKNEFCLFIGLRLYEVRKSRTFYKMSSHQQISKFAESMYHLGISTTQRRKLYTFLQDKSIRIRRLVILSPGQRSTELITIVRPIFVSGFWCQ